MTDQITQTELEREVDALVACLSAWCYPADVDVRMTAVQACGLCKVDYIESIASLMEAAPATVRPDDARFIVVATFVDRVCALRLSGHAPRPRILATGKQADGLGRDPASYEPDEEQA